MNLGKRIVEIRKDKNMSQEAFAELFNVTRQTVSNWENLKSYPDIETLIKISNTFNISLDVLLKEDKRLIKDINNKMYEKKDNNKKYIFVILYCISIIILFITKWLEIKYKISNIYIYLIFSIIGLILIGTIIQIVVAKFILKKKMTTKEILYDIFTEEVEE